MANLVTGGTGFVGSRLITKLDGCVITSRHAEKSKQKFGDSISDAIQWDYQKDNLLIPNHLNFAGVVNLMGEPIAEGRWTTEKKKRIADSRIEGTRQLVKALLEMPTKPEVVISASAVGIYGSRGDEVIDERTPAGTGFLADVCQRWEAAAQPLVDAGIRVVWLRLGIVMGKEGGALEKLIPIFKMGGGGRLGDGKHFVPWIHIDDLVELILFSMRNLEIAGPVNGTAPNPVRNSELTSALAKAVNRPAIIPVPKFGLKLMYGEFAESLFASQRVMPEVALRHGFQFAYPHIQPALNQIVES